EQKTGGLSGNWSNGFKYAVTVYRVAYEIQENKVIPVLLYGTHNNFYELAENTRNFIRVDESASVEL
ncbi:TPA: type II toxin-antitoxin system RelE/ParE family toxin, partial [Enterococcus faecium]|nr:type II toxin-antitoxin system RelE/ParE family toxin [Enterococcus faecium]HAQ4699655.1 hypothetical protein [Enterococcus faecium]HAR1431001.1 hypothetical protein [Enterococcus faecium]HAZ0975018.1 hypothetical protein [Enterococcus faecium]HBA0412408.1 hypothetical protein [Enterococcus faecium]